ncbi:aldo/keto reductase [Treponema brennaborense]|uniref:Aldo/keto reductase n=1 Tax=Treponema brennaborense (strain DSM 12168 / CIP 105900 / DD5/3) TaxID=906968 RepID=F4LIH6_TREBD|nr:aldo/keto reductase [Treponema brennaborense]AEE16217.1 aldo/keto reductase [Treponema brennaborense DSM 12168]
MEYVALGKSNLLVSRTAFGAQNLQKLENPDDAEALVTQAYEGGVNFFDTARSSPESERRLGAAVYAIRKNILLATKTTALSAAQIRAELEESLDTLQTDYVDLYQLEMPPFVPERGASDGIYETLEDLKKSGKIRHIGFVTDSLPLARCALANGLYETLQYPFNMLCPDETRALVRESEAHDVGFIAMQPLCGGVIRNIPLAYGFLRRFENAVPVWGVQHQEELQQILYFETHPPVIDDKFLTDEEALRSFFS